MNKVFDFLKGKKTYIIATLMFVNAGGIAVGWWTLEQSAVVNAFLLPLGLGFLRAAVGTSPNA